MSTMAAVIERGATQPQACREASRIASIDIFRDLEAVEPLWRRLEQPDHLATPYQRFDLLAAWLRHVGPHENLSPFIIVAYDSDQQPLLLLPLAIATRHGVRVACFPGGKHTTFNMPLWRRDFAQSATAADLAGLIQQIRALDQVDLLELQRQPQRWRDLANPMALLPHQRAVNDCPLLTMQPGAEPTTRLSNSFRRRLKGKERKLQALPGYRYLLARTPEEIRRQLDGFFAIKPLRMAQQNLPDVFADPGIENFLRAACNAPLADGSHVIEIHALECDDEMIAMFAGVADGQRFSMMFNTYTLSEASRYSPGLILMRNIIDHYGDLGYTALDLGIGSDDYKRLFCKDDEPIFDSFVALSTRGKLAATAMSSLAKLKRHIKQTPALMQLAQRLRGALPR